ncbi:peptidoglycan-binding protein [Streptomyces luteireticuli]|uniref:N-acetylmuramoyl-L-alanine amidase domain-containing protein n=1 Tax=Streptomyces luteireticuli TaxID=173858 RepID=A0ABN0YZZ6_9ACTN
MATPLTADRLAAALRAEGVGVVEVDNWRTHNRNHKGAFGPVNGVIIHHTVSRGTDSSVALCYDGYDELPGPLCHGVIDKAGTVHLVSSGRANHAGSGDGDVLTAVVAESPRLPRPTSNDTDGNVHFYGFECINMGDGSDPWPAVQLDAIERAAAAICRAYGWSAASVIGHKEWTNQKTDPVGFSMDSMRARIASRLRTAPDKPKPTPKPTGYEPFPGADFFKKSPRSPIITAMGRRLVAEECGRYDQGPGPQWTDADRTSFRAWQHKIGDDARFCDGWPGPRQWDALKVPRVTTP